jgi:hypothetical protein
MEITTHLGKDVLLFHGMHGHEELSRVGEYRLELLSLKADINTDQVLGKDVTIAVARQDDSTRYFHGYVTRFSAGGSYGRYRRYYATVHPWLWFLSRTADSRIFQEMTVKADHREGVRRSFNRIVQVGARRVVPEMDLLRAVPRDRLELHLPVDGAGRDLLLLQTRKRQAHAGPDRQPLDAPAQSGRPGAVHRRGRPRPARHRAHELMDADARGAVRACTCTTITTSSARAWSCGPRR